MVLRQAYMDTDGHAWQFAGTAMLMRKGNNRENQRLRAREQDSGGGVGRFFFLLKGRETTLQVETKKRRFDDIMDT